MKSTYQSSIDFVRSSAEFDAAHHGRRHVQCLKRASLSAFLLGIACLAVAPLTTSCSADRTYVGDTGAASVGVVAQALSAEDVTRVTLTISGDGISPNITQELRQSRGQWTANLSGIPVGTNRTFHADAYDADNQRIYEGEATGVTITADEPVSVVLVLQQEEPSLEFENNVPLITSLTTSKSQVAQGETVLLAITANDPDNDSLSYAWTATGGTLSDATSARPTWTAPATDGSYTLSASVSDGKGSQAGLSAEIEVSSSGSANLITSFNTWPVVTQTTATPGQVRPGASTHLAVTATDNDGDAITYAWSDDCGGAFSDTSAMNPVWTAPSSPPGDGTCTLIVTPTDSRGGSTSSRLSIGVNLPVVNSPPVLGLSYASSESVYATESVSIGITARDPEEGALSFSWSATGGTLGTANSSAGSSELTWTAPAAAGSYTITGTARDALGAEVTREFTIQVAGACSDGQQNYGETGLDCGGPCAPCAGGSQVFAYTGADQTFVVPANVTGPITVKLWGGGGGGGDSQAGTPTVVNNRGGAGGYATGTFTAAPGTSFTVLVGAGGVFGSWNGTRFYGGGGGGGFGTAPAGSGGGRSAVQLAGVEWITAGGGGGGGRDLTNNTTADASGGAGGGISGVNGLGAAYQMVGCWGNGGTQTAAGNNPQRADAPGAQFLGGTNPSGDGSRFSGGGGGGWFGGGGGSYASVCAGAGGGGGSGYTSANISGGELVAGIGATPPNTNDSAYVAGVGVGGNHNDAGGPGLVVITW